MGACGSSNDSGAKRAEDLERKLNRLAEKLEESQNKAKEYRKKIDENSTEEQAKMMRKLLNAKEAYDEARAEKERMEVFSELGIVVALEKSMEHC